MKTKEELNELKEEVEAVNKKLAELTEDELAQVTGGGVPCPPPRKPVDMPWCGFREMRYALCPYKNDYSQCPDRNVTKGCSIESYF